MQPDKKDSHMTDVELAYTMQSLFNRNITSVYFSSYKGEFGKVQVDVMNLLYDNAGDRINAIRLAELLNVPKQHISKIVRRLETEGLITSFPDPSDGRSRLLQLSQSGMELVRDHIRISNRHFQEATATLSAEDRAELKHAMEAIVRILEKI